MKIKLIIALMIFSSRVFSQENLKIEKENPFKLQHFCTGVTLGYESGFKTYSSKFFIGHNTTLCSKEGKYLLLIDNYFAYNTAVGKWNINNTLTYRINHKLGFAYSSDFYIQNDKLNYAYGFGVTYELGSFISLGSYYYPKINSIINHSNFGVRLALRPINLLIFAVKTSSHNTQ